MMIKNEKQINNTSQCSATANLQISHCQKIGLMMGDNFVWCEVLIALIHNTLLEG
uniref:Uncharacterized protein n=1 Tax=Rhizophora mucronata TaxID=61149 RepID=A0A2P2P7G3_RHIMU